MQMTGKATHRHTVLVVEDDCGTREAFMELARLHHLEPVGAWNGREALAHLHGGLRPCLIVLDLAMPEMDGFEFRRAQLADPTIAAIPVAVMSGRGWAGEADARKLGLAHFLHKPIEMDALLRLFTEHCG